MSGATLTAEVAALVNAHRGQSGVRLLPDGLEAFALRTHSARLAQHSLDIQTYIWRDDATGRFIAHELLLAADRGIRVRVLLDDMDARPKDLALEALDAHPYIEVRMFNPFRTRSGLLRTLAEISQRGWRLNHRMHNKIWIVDDALTITGGRNIGDEYFAAAGEINFIDLDLLLLGPVVRQARREFDRYWTSSLSVPISRLRKYIDKKLHPRSFRTRVARAARKAAASEYAVQLHGQDGVETLLRHPFIWSTHVRIVADDPRKALGDADIQVSHVLDSMVSEIASASRQVLLISPYFVPGIGGTAALRRLALQGAEVAVLTNSLAATDVAVVHSGYTKYRLPLLEAGIKLYEMKATPAVDEHSRFRVGSSRASLHTKSAIIDGERVFVGSFNIDPRSAALNCEMGVWTRSRQLAAELSRSFQNGTDLRRSLMLSLTTQNHIEWLEQCDGMPLRHTREPYANWTRRAIVKMLGAFPIESQL